MDIPPGYQKWPLFWFQCPSCGHHCYRSIARTNPHALPRSIFRFWCENCGSYSALKGPPWKPGVFAFCAFGLGFLVLVASLQFLPQYVLVVGLFSCSVTLFAWLTLNRLGNTYVREHKDAP